jgi:hypothetical protein
VQIFGAGAGRQRDIWVEFHEIVDRPGRGDTSSDMVQVGKDLPVGSSVVVSDDEGNTVRATVVGRQRGDTHNVITLHLHMATFRLAAHAADDWRDDDWRDDWQPPWAEGSTPA